MATETQYISDGQTITVNMLSRIRTKTRLMYQNTELLDTQIDPRYAHHFPLFNHMTIPIMLRDSRIRFGLSLIKGPIGAYTRFYTKEQAEEPDTLKAIAEQGLYFAMKVEAKNPETEKFIVDTLTRFWLTGLEAALKAIEWGYSGSQVYYKRNGDGKIQFDKLQYYQSSVVRALTSEGRFIGMRLIKQGDNILFPKAFWHVHNRQVHRFYGQSRLEGAHVPWHESWTYGGARDVRRLWWFKNAFDSGILRFPEGSTKDEAGNVVSNVSVAASLMDNRLAGAYFLLPSKKDADGNYLWDFEPPSAPLAPVGLREYLNDLDDEKLEGMGIAPEVVESSSTNGMGAATGRMIPYMSFIATLFPIVMDLLTDIDEQMLRTMLLVNKMDPDYNVSPIVALSQPTEEQNEETTGFNNAKSDK